MALATRTRAWRRAWVVGSPFFPNKLHVHARVSRKKINFTFKPKLAINHTLFFFPQSTPMTTWKCGPLYVVDSTRSTRGSIMQFVGSWRNPRALDEWLTQVARPWLRHGPRLSRILAGMFPQQFLDWRRTRDFSQCRVCFDVGSRRHVVPLRVLTLIKHASEVGWLHFLSIPK